MLYCGSCCYVVMNAFPYTSGHLMVVPLSHGPSMGDFPLETLCEMTSLLKECERIIGEAYHPGGYNMGINIGQAAGAGIAGHLHAHILPRWEGDTNFLTTVHETRVVPEDLRETYDRLLPFFQTL
ncbi:MAG: Histidine triad (HIT) protein [Leptospirillum sp. Group IV 'UBA BS']|nr:MAG: Histidine triad (HIT) protein [Leptospirillum sp. Group IV 'UBA BS']